NSNRLMVDWRQLERWGIGGERLPRGTVIRFRNLSLWDEYKGDVLAGLTAIVVQLSLILIFVTEMRARQRAAKDPINMLEETAHLNRVASMGQMAASLAHELAQPLTAILSNAQAAVRFANRPEPDLEEIRGALAYITEDDQRARAFVQNMRSLFQRHSITR